MIEILVGLAALAILLGTDTGRALLWIAFCGAVVLGVLFVLTTIVAGVM